MAAIFDLNGDEFQVDVVSLQREFTHQPQENVCTTQDGMVHYDPDKVYCHYDMVLRAKPGKENELNRLWNYLLLPRLHICTFPDGDSSICQQMYVSSGKQSLVYTQGQTSRWGELKVRFVGAEPRWL